MMASVEQREVLRCDHCSLVQFRTANSLCRRCHKCLEVEIPVAEPAPLSLVPPQTDKKDGLQVATAVRDLRHVRNLSQRQLAASMGVPRTYISKIENGKAMPTLRSLDRLARALKVDIAPCCATPTPATPTRPPCSPPTRSLPRSPPTPRSSPTCSAPSSSTTSANWPPGRTPHRLGQFRTLSVAMPRTRARILIAQAEEGMLASYPARSPPLARIHIQAGLPTLLPPPRALGGGGARSTASSTPPGFPQHVAIIMDGNGRWAGKRALKRFLGHQQGAESVQFVVETASRINLPFSRSTPSRWRTTCAGPSPRSTS